MNKVILDASALLALIKNETGADQVEKELGNIVMSSVNVSEVAATLSNSEMSRDEIEECILPLISQIIPFDEEHAFQTAYLRKSTQDKGLSLGDRACIALGIKMNHRIYTADKIWKEITIEGADIKLIR